MLVFLCLQAFCSGSVSVCVCVCVCATFIITKKQILFLLFREASLDTSTLEMQRALSLCSDDDETNIFFVSLQTADIRVSPRSTKCVLHRERLLSKRIVLLKIQICSLVFCLFFFSEEGLGRSSFWTPGSRFCCDKLTCSALRCRIFN